MTSLGLTEDCEAAAEGPGSGGSVGAVTLVCTSGGHHPAYPVLGVVAGLAGSALGLRTGQACSVAFLEMLMTLGALCVWSDLSIWAHISPSPREMRSELLQHNTSLL